MQFISILDERERFMDSLRRNVIMKSLMDRIIKTGTNVIQLCQKCTTKKFLAKPELIGDIDRPHEGKRDIVFQSER